ncbi:hypothetical protein IR151_11130 [Clostridioides sp. ES-S-0006-03]|uniref:hypothetical protein n=1 Tax=Clostridioides sp. ES-S-0006-03 TaxID=2770775 RepID=UPI001D0C35FA|nr:hypothetical protein [Clostridioides sp. ES-S-0006-03]
MLKVEKIQDKQEVEVLSQSRDCSTQADPDGNYYAPCWDDCTADDKPAYFK